MSELAKLVARLEELKENFSHFENLNRQGIGHAFFMASRQAWADEIDELRKEIVSLVMGPFIPAKYEQNPLFSEEKIGHRQ